MFPLVDKDNDEQRRHTEVNALKLKREQLSDNASQYRKERPVEMAEKRNAEHGAVLVVLGHIVERSVYRIRFIRHRMYHIQLTLSHSAEILQKCKAVEALPAVYKQNSERHRK